MGLFNIVVYFESMLILIIKIIYCNVFFHDLAVYERKKFNSKTKKQNFTRDTT